ncbi:MAG: ABC transporter permease [Dongiaceae bacterium]
MSTKIGKLPRWVDIGLIPLVNVALAFLVAGLIVLAIGENPLTATRLMLTGALGSSEGIGYTLYYTTNYIFTGLAVAFAFHAGLFNIGGEGQAYLGGLGVGLVLLAFDHSLPFAILLPLAIFAAMIFGAAWALIPAYLQAYRGSHIVITTIMFNFLASALMVYLMVNVLTVPGAIAPETRDFEPTAYMPFVHEVLAGFGIVMPSTPLNLSILLALVACVFVWLYLWHTPWGYELRTLGQSEKAAVYAGIRTKRVVLVALCISGALAGLVGVNEIMGVQHRLLLNFNAGYGFAGIAVALMGRNHPIGVILASFLFGVLNQGGAELSFDMPDITRDMTVVIQGLVILFSGALVHLTRPWLERLFARLPRRVPAPQGA